jgi:hypothetical protein
MDGTIENYELKMESFGLDENHSINFFNIPEGYTMKKFTISEHDTYNIGRLRSFNRLGILKSWKKQVGGNLYNFFREALEKRGWNLNDNPNPYAVLVKYKNKKI